EMRQKRGQIHNIVKLIAMTRMTNDANIVFECSNQEKIKELQSSLGKLFQDSTLECSTWTKKTAEMPCHLVLPDDEPENKDDSSSFEILSESDSCRVATSLCLDLQTEDPKENTIMELRCYVMEVKQFNSDGHALWSLGDYFEIISKEESEKDYDDRIAWDVLNDGIAFVLHKYTPGELDIPSSIKDDIKKKKHY
ncbi:2795_t:CDS:2, partial [Entrophospora sp. SA101]